MNEVKFWELKVGDRVILEGSGRLRVDIVAKVTPTQIVLASNTGVGRMGRYRRMDGRPIGGIYWPSITGVATPEQVAKWEAAEAAKQRSIREARERQEAIDARERQLASLFPKRLHPVVRADGNKYTLEFTLTATQARRLARTLDQTETK